jgi:hypothetical protein
VSLEKLDRETAGLRLEISRRDQAAEKAEQVGGRA